MIAGSLSYVSKLFHTHGEFVGVFYAINREMRLLLRYIFKPVYFSLLLLANIYR